MNTVKWTILSLTIALTSAHCQDARSVQNSILVNNNVPPYYSFYQPTYWTPDGLFWYYSYPTLPFYNQYPPRPVYWNPVQQNEGVRYPPPGGLQTSPTYPPGGHQTSPTYPPGGHQTSPTHPPSNIGTTQSTEFANESEFVQEQITTEVNSDPFQPGLLELDWSFLEDDEFDWLNTIDFGEEDWTDFDVKSFEEHTPTSVISGFVATNPNTAIARSTSTATGQRGAVSSASAFTGRR